MLKQAHIFRDNQQVPDRVMDSNDLERERGITILAKNTAVRFGAIKINIVDTPGHADFGGEVERVLNMVDGVLLLVDAAEGPMPQTRFVLRKALELGHGHRRDQQGGSQLTPAQLGGERDLRSVHRAGRNRRAGRFHGDLHRRHRRPSRRGAGGVAGQPQTALRCHRRESAGPTVDPDAPTQLLVTNLHYDDYKGKIVLGRLSSGTLRRGQAVARIDRQRRTAPGEDRAGLPPRGAGASGDGRGSAGEIVALTGIPDVNIGETITDPDDPRPLPPIIVEEPTVRMTFGVNTSPLSGREGTGCTSRKLKERLERELERNVALRVEPTDAADTFLVSGRGELHLAILIETMRREGYEFQVSAPEVILHEDPDTGELMEPMEEVHVEVPDQYSGVVVEMLGPRKGQLTNLRQGRTHDGTVYYTYLVPTRGLLGFRQAFLTATRGTGIVHSIFYGYEPYRRRPSGARDRVAGGVGNWHPTAYSLFNAQERGRLFLAPGVEVYEGMIVGRRPAKGIWR